MNLSLFVYDLFDAVSGESGGFVFPYSDHRPARLGQHGFGCEVAPDIGLEFSTPPISIGLRQGSLFGVSVGNLKVSLDILTIKAWPPW